MHIKFRSCAFCACHITPQRCEIKDPHKLIHRTEEALDIQSDWVFVDVMVHLPQEWTLVHQQDFIHQLHHPQPSQRHQKGIFTFTWHHVLNMLHIKSLLHVLSAAVCFRLITWLISGSSLKGKEATKLWTLRSSTSGKFAAQNSNKTLYVAK